MSNNPEQTVAAPKPENAVPTMPRQPSSSALSEATRSIRMHLWVGVAVLALLFGGVGGWTALASIESAVMAPGTVVVRGFQKRVQHETGGTVSDIHVRSGDVVEAGDVLLELDAGQLSSEIAALEKRRFDLLMRRHRLIAERDGEIWGELDPALKTMVSRRPELADIVAVQRKLLLNRAKLAKRREAQLRERITQARREIGGLEAIAEARESELEVLEEEFKGLSQLKEQGLVQISRYNSMKRTIADKKGQIGQVHAQIAETGGRISEIELRSIEVVETAQDQALSGLEQVEAEFTQVDERLSALVERRRKLKIRATADGAIHEMNQHTIGGVIGPGDTVALIIPTSDELVVDANLQTIDRDQVTVGQDARVRFSAFNQRKTPELTGTVDFVASDQSVDPNTGAPFYKVRIVLSADEVARLGNVDVVPGMPADVMVTSQERQVITYLTKPIVDQFERVFREE